MSLQVEKLEKNMAKLTIEVSAEELEKAIEGAYQKNKNKISIPGFRKGKAPRKMIEQMYGKSVFYEDAANALIPDAYDKALEECEEQIVSSPKIDVTQLEAGKPFIFTAEVALKPEVTLGKYKSTPPELFSHFRKNGQRKTAFCQVNFKKPVRMRSAHLSILSLSILPYPAPVPAAKAVCRTPPPASAGRIKSPVHRYNYSLTGTPSVLPSPHLQ